MFKDPMACYFNIGISGPLTQYLKTVQKYSHYEPVAH